MLFFPKNELKRNQLCSKVCTDNYTANATYNVFPRTCCNVHKKHDKREPGPFNEKTRCVGMLCLCSKAYCCYDKHTHKHKFSSKGLNKKTLEMCGVAGPMSKYRKVLEEAVNINSTNRGFWTFQHSVATYEQTKKGLAYLYPKRLVEKDEIHAKPLHLYVLIIVLIVCPFLYILINFCKLLHKLFTKH